METTYLTTYLKFCLDANHLDELAHKYHQEYINAKPFPHIVFDNFLPETVLENILQEFPDTKAQGWRKFERVTEKKLDSFPELEM